MYIVIVSLMLAITVAGPIVFFYFGERSAKRGKAALAVNLVSFVAMFLLAVVFMFGRTAYGAPDANGASDMALAAAFIGAALVTGLCSIGTGIAVSSAAAAAIGAISENENNFGKAMIFVAMAEGIAIYGLLISFMILGRV
ncbi:MAG: ATP synthase subunit C [Defluviitaleaceae bacterium]|nr:ATP synthase subunit C [Defluviitaleaceae bacterium]